MPILYPRGQIVGWCAEAFLVGIVLATITLSVSVNIPFIMGLLVVSLLLIPWVVDARIRITLLCIACGCFGCLRVVTVDVPFLSLASPMKAMTIASAKRKLIAKELSAEPLVAVQNNFTTRIKEALPSEEASLLSGMLYGETYFSKETQTTFRRAGILHVVAVSGANISILVVLVARFCVRLGANRRQVWVALSVSIILFVLFVSPSASVTRAAIMGLLSELGPLCGRVPRPTRLLLIAACLFTFWQPGALLLDAGFALSFLAMSGLILYGPLIERLIPDRIPALLREAVVSTMAATLFTTPYLLWAFHQMSLFGLLTNLIIVPLVPWTMLFGAIALFLPIHSSIFLPAKGCLSFILWVAHLTDGVTMGVWTKISFSWQSCVACYVVLLSLWGFIEQRNRVMHRIAQRKIK